MLVYVIWFSVRNLCGGGGGRQRIPDIPIRDGLASRGGGGGVQNGKIAALKPFATPLPPLRKRVKLFVP